MGAQITDVAHQEQRGEIVQRVGKPGQSTPQAQICFRLLMAVGAQCDQVVGAVGFLQRQELPERDFMMHVVRFPRFGCSANLAGILIPDADRHP